MNLRLWNLRARSGWRHGSWPRNDAASVEEGTPTPEKLAGGGVAWQPVHCIWPAGGLTWPTQCFQIIGISNQHLKIRTFHLTVLVSGFPLKGQRVSNKGHFFAWQLSALWLSGHYPLQVVPASAHLPNLLPWLPLKKLTLRFLVCFIGLEHEGGGAGFDGGRQDATCNSTLFEFSETSK